MNFLTPNVNNTNTECTKLYTKLKRIYTGWNKTDRLATATTLSKVENSDSTILISNFKLRFT